MKRPLYYQAAVLALMLSCEQQKDATTPDSSSNANTTNNTNVTNNATIAVPVKRNSDECRCIWAGPVSYEISTVHRIDEGVFVSANLSWEPCCAERSSSTRAWFIDWKGGSEVRELSPVAIEDPIPSDPMEPIYILNPARDVALKLHRRQDASVTTVQLKVGDVVAWPSKDVLSELLVEVSR